MTQCRECGETGYLLEEEGGYQYAVRCRCWRERRDTGLLETAGIPGRYAHCALEQFDVAPGGTLNPSLARAKKMAQDFVDRYPALDQRGLFFHGAYGVGKTHLAVAVLYELIMRKGTPALFCDFQDLLKRIQDSYNPVSQSTEMALLQPVVRAEVVLLDDLGSKVPTPWLQETLAYIIYARYNAQRVTLCTSNYDLEESGGREGLPTRIGGRIMSRLYEMCAFVALEGEDYRRRRR